MFAAFYFPHKRSSSSWKLRIQGDVIRLSVASWNIMCIASKEVFELMVVEEISWSFYFFLLVSSAGV